ncbi:hypothetical protein JCM11641_005434 [Rhodosporidiobolus odoratus]
MANKAILVEQLQDASRGFEALLDNRLQEARTILSARDDSAFHLVGLGISAFLAAILSREDGELKNATEVLIKAEALANSQINSRRTKEKDEVYPPGTEMKLLTGDATIGQALVAILSESYVEFVKAVWKLNKSYKIFMAASKVVFPDGVDEDETLDSVFTKLNAHYLKQTSAASSLSVPGASTTGGFFSSWGRKKSAALTPQLRHATSSSALASPSTLDGTGFNGASASEPPTTASSAQASVEELGRATGKVSLGDEGSYPAPLWKDEPLTTMISSCAALGSGMFGLVFSMMPPKMRKMIAWFGFSNWSRPVALKLLTVASSTGNDVHGHFASLTLITYYCFILLMSGWQANQAYLINQCTVILDRVHEKLPHGSLWTLNRSKLARMKRDADTAISILEGALKEGTTFREADSLLVFELSWLYLSQARFIDCADSFDRMNGMNSWSPATYVAISSGALVDAYHSTPDLRTPDRIERLNAAFDKLPTLFSMKRVFGEKPVTETFIARRLEANKAKLQRWIASGRVQPDAKVWEVIKLSNAMELGFFWATIGNRSPEAGVRKQIALLSSFSPAPRFVPSSADPDATFSDLAPTVTGASLNRRRTPSSTASTRQFSSDDLDSTDEIAIRDLLLGALYTALGDSSSLRIGQAYFTAVLDADASGLIFDELWVAPFARFSLAAALGKEGDVEERTVKGQEEEELNKVWKGRIEKAEGFLESRVLMLKDELATKKRSLGL